jgi:ABC-type polysaccharide/polyol phosphate transport system ATPase subunit
MAVAAANGARPAAISADDLRKEYTLGEHRNLRLTINRTLRRQVGSAQAPLQALGGIDFTVYRGESLGIVGHNGSGKSTLLQILSGTTLPTGGQMRVWGRVLPLMAVGAGFHPELTGRENVKLFAASAGIPLSAVDSRMAAVTEFAELERHMDTPTKRFSSGMLSRLSFAIAVQFPADIYVFDEVLAVVDADFRSVCLAEIKRLHQDGRTVIFVSHDKDQIADVCQRVMWLEGGRIERLGPTDDVLAAYERHAQPV